MAAGSAELAVSMAEAIRPINVVAEGGEGVLGAPYSAS